MNEKIVKQLTDVGLNEKEAKIYLASLECGTQPTAKIAETAGYNRITTYTILEKLPKQEMLVFTKSFFEGKTHTIIAEELNISLRSVNRYKQKTLDLLRSEMKDFLTLISFYYLLKI